MLRSNLKKYGLIPVVLLLLLLMFFSCQKDEVEVAIYYPQANDRAISFTHKFHPADYETGRDLVIEEFGNAIMNSGQTRRTYFLVRPDSSEVLVISFFHPSSSTQTWLDSDAREAVLSQLRPLYRVPLLVREYTTEVVHDTHQDNEAVPLYLPEIGDEVLFFVHHFKEGGHDAGTDIVVNGFSQAIKESGQMRRTYFLDDPIDREMVVPSFFHTDSDTETWLDKDERQAILDMLAPYYEEPVQVHAYTTARVMDTN